MKKKIVILLLLTAVYCFSQLPVPPVQAVPANPPTSPKDPASYVPEFVGDRAYEIPGMPATLPDESLPSATTNVVGWLAVSPTKPVLTYYMRFEIRAGSPDAKPHTIIIRETTEPMEFFSWTVTTNIAEDPQ